ncbi:hypothetical protein C1646_777721 [Rhizophagus diaphanus]|nr:hypothetical protein C1646_777721 [Rhizophagus diaphanus] [Rhizophagus sp. MUCL 43196]
MPSNTTFIVYTLKNYNRRNNITNDTLLNLEGPLSSDLVLINSIELVQINNLNRNLIL